MEKEYEYEGHKFWITIKEAINPSTNEGIFIAFVSDAKPNAFFYGQIVKDSNGNDLFFENVLTAQTNAYAIKKSIIDSKRNQISN